MPIYISRRETNISVGVCGEHCTAVHKGNSLSPTPTGKNRLLPDFLYGNCLEETNINFDQLRSMRADSRDFLLAVVPPC